MINVVTDRPELEKDHFRHCFCLQPKITLLLLASVSPLRAQTLFPRAEINVPSTHFCEYRLTPCDNSPPSSQLLYARSEPASNQPDPDSKPASVVVSRVTPPTDFGKSVYYRNKFEFSFDAGWLPINIPFVFDVFLGDGYNMTPLKYTLVPTILSVRWQYGPVKGPSFLRGNWDLSCSLSATLIPRGPETRYFAWIIGIRRNFVPRHWKIDPYWDGRIGLGNINAKGPDGVAYAQGENFTFTVNLGSGVRYNFNPRWGFSAGLNYMHISNLYLSEPRYADYGINVYGPMFGLYIRLGKPRPAASQ